jgi:hypothetical protein
METEMVAAQYLLNNAIAARRNQRAAASQDQAVDPAIEALFAANVLGIVLFLVMFAALLVANV